MTDAVAHLEFEFQDNSKMIFVFAGDRHVDAARMFFNFCASLQQNEEWFHFGLNGVSAALGHGSVRTVTHSRVPPPLIGSPEGYMMWTAPTTK